MAAPAANDKSFLELDVRYVSPRAAKSIVAQCGKIKPTTETLQSVNAFLDELIMHCAQLLYTQRQSGKSFPIDVEQAKLVLSELIKPGVFYNELLSAAAVAVRHQLRTPKSPGPQSTFGSLTAATITSADALAQLLRARCLYYSTLGGDASSFQAAWESDIIDMQSAVFFATAVEFIGMHALREGARVALYKERPLVRMQDTYNVLATDEAVGPFFQQTAIYRNLKQLLLSAKASASSTRLSSATALQAHVTVEPVPQLSAAKYPDLQPSISPATSLLLTDESSRSPLATKSPTVDRSDTDRLQSPSSGHQAANQSEAPLSSSRERSRGSSDALSSKQSNEGNEVWRVMGLNSPTRTTDQALEFEDLLKGKDTIKVSLTPNRLNNIEVAKNVAPIRPRAAQKNNISLLTGRRASIVPPQSKGSLLTPPAIGDDDNSDLSADEDIDDQGHPRKRGETLYEFLNSTGPEDLPPNSRAGVKKQASHSGNLNSVREEANGSATRPNGARFNTVTGAPGESFSSHSMSGSQANSSNNNNNTNKYDDSDDDDDDILLAGQRRRKEPKEESLADFLRSTGPPEPVTTASTSPSPVPTKRPSRGMMRLFSRFNSGSSASPPNSNGTDQVSRRSSVNGSMSMNGTSESPLNSTGSASSRRHIAIKIPYSPPLSEPTALRSPILPSPPMASPKPICEERSTQASEPIIATKEKGTLAPLPVMAEIGIQTDVIVEVIPEPEAVEEKVEPIVEPVETLDAETQTEFEINAAVETEVVEPKVPSQTKVIQVDLAPKDISLPKSTAEEEIELLETEEEREAARQQLAASEEIIRVPAAVLDLIREALPTLIESGEVNTCMEFLEELLTSGTSVRLVNSETQTRLSSNDWLFQPTVLSSKTIKDVATSAVTTCDNSTATTSMLTAVPVLPERRRSIV